MDRYIFSGGKTYRVTVRRVSTDKIKPKLELRKRILKELLSGRYTESLSYKGEVDSLKRNLDFISGRLKLD